jgi:hypothetical protein
VVDRAWVDMSRQLMEQVFLEMTNVESWVQAEKGYNDVDV